MTAAELAQIHHAAFTTLRAWREEEFKSLLQDPSTFLCTAPLGFALGRRAGPEVELLTIAVLPEAQRQGIARNLMIAFENAASGAEEIFLEVAEDNRAAISLYTQTGFEKIACRKDYYNGVDGKKRDAVIMRKALK